MPAMQETLVQFLGQEDPLGWEIATHSNILAWEIPCTEGPGVHSPWGCRIGHTSTHKHKQHYCNPLKFVDTWEEISRNMREFFIFCFNSVCVCVSFSPV